jgi:pyruvate-formate lyase
MTTLSELIQDLKRKNQQSLNAGLRAYKDNIREAKNYKKVSLEGKYEKMQKVLKKKIS